VLVLAFIIWFINKGMEFRKSTIWTPLANVNSWSKTTSLPTTSSPPTKDANKFFSRKEVVEIFIKNKLPQKSLYQFLVAKNMHAVLCTDVVPYGELTDYLAEFQVTLNQVKITHTIPPLM
jgi:hypothetical protein